VHIEAVSEAIAPLIDDEVIDEILYPVKSGKEATLFCAHGGRRAPAELVAVKVYKPQQFRSFRNDSVYQEGRVILDSRARRAAAKRTRFGREVQSTRWTNHEYETLRVLARAGSNVPRPLGQAAGAIAMEWIGGSDAPAPQLKELRFSGAEALRFFEQIVGDVELWLACNVVHGDLSAYNILFDGQRLVTIDFPQACDPRTNGNAPRLLARDLDNVCRYFARFGVEADGGAIADDLWQRFERGEL
jgi:RIO kinase 1